MPKDMTECPHCGHKSAREVLTNINVDKNPELRAAVQDLSCFRWVCPNCGVSSLVIDPCLYHDMSGQFMVWLSPEGKPQDIGNFDPLAGYTLRYVEDLNAFREKINVLERGLDDRAVELMKLLLLLQIQRDLDVVELLFHDLNERDGTFTYVAILSDGVEQYISMPGDTYQRLANDVAERLYTNNRQFQKIDLEWAKDALELLHG